MVCCFFLFCFLSFNTPTPPPPKAAKAARAQHTQEQHAELSIAQERAHTLEQHNTRLAKQLAAAHREAAGAKEAATAAAQRARKHAHEVGYVMCVKVTAFHNCTNPVRVLIIPPPHTPRRPYRYKPFNNGYTPSNSNKRNTPYPLHTIPAPPLPPRHPPPQPPLAPPPPAHHSTPPRPLQHFVLHTNNNTHAHEPPQTMQTPDYV